MIRIILCLLLAISPALAAPSAGHSNADNPGHFHGKTPQTDTIGSHSHSHACCLENSPPFAATVNRVQPDMASAQHFHGETVSSPNPDAASRLIFRSCCAQFPSNHSYLIGSPVMLV